MDYDVIGDLHGDALRLRALLREFGHREDASGFAAPAGRQAVFLGDLIDRGPAQLEVLDIVRRMVDRGDARCVMGNHELNAIGWLTPDERRGGFLRPHTADRRRQHAQFLEQVGEDSVRHREWVDWFRTLPVALDLGGLRAVHAWWNDAYVACVSAAASPFADVGRLQQAFDRGSPLGRAIDGLTKGHELPLPGGASFRDKDGHERREVRTRWWDASARDYRSLAVIEDEQRHLVPEVPLPADHAATPIDGAPVFVGHYWLRGRVSRQHPRLACLDYSGAKGGPIVGYRWRGETEIRDEGFVTVPSA
jgi:hypothetical protein